MLSKLAYVSGAMPGKPLKRKPPLPEEKK